ncbi:type II secretion system F family protein [Pyrodictium delaneyi]|uniref:Type II secretion system protein GspF domain-containing protein n=1 Tax=Pyrodictium delaneyi TaxID=1273541 RepID=A0A211YRI0_9CREN|nr:type II secretion system F family protein [Pyrodictium delaneyi]OWJ55546.1 hypothetical protein Pdsh_01785 [Pyrodictium delaneyi]
MEALERLGERFNPDLRYHVLGSGLSSSLERYTLAYLVVMVIVVSSVAMIVWIALYLRLGVQPVIASIAALGAAFASFVLMLALYIAIPVVAYKNRGGRLEPRFLLFAEALATKLLAGAGLAESFMRLYEKELKELREFRIELEYIASGIKAGMPVETVLEEAARITPVYSLRRLLAGLSAAARTGTGVNEIVLSSITEYLYGLEVEIEKLSSSLGAILEVFVAVSVMLPVAIGVVGLLLVFQPIPGLSFDSLLFLSTFILVPMMSAAVIVIVDSMVSRIRV